MGKVKLLGRQAILEADDYKEEVVPVPEWGGAVVVKGLSGKERDEYEASMLSMRKDGRLIPNLANARAKLVVMSVLDGPKGALMFSDNDIPALSEKSALAVSRIADKARELAGLSEADLEELVGKSEAGQSEGSTSD